MLSMSSHFQRYIGRQSRERLSALFFKRNILPSKMKIHRYEEWIYPVLLLLIAGLYYSQAFIIISSHPAIIISRSTSSIIIGTTIVNENDHRILTTRLSILNNDDEGKENDNSINDDSNDDDDVEEEEEEESRSIGLPALGPAGTTSSRNNDDGATTLTLNNGANSTTTATATIDGSINNKNISFVSSKFSLQYTCNVCEHRNRVIVSRMAYREGVVIAICKGCTAKHWIADNLDPTLSDTNIEEYFVSQGKKEEQVTRVNGDVYEIERVWGFTTPGEITNDSGETVLE